MRVRVYNVMCATVRAYSCVYFVDPYECPCTRTPRRMRSRARVYVCVRACVCLCVYAYMRVLRYGRACM